MNAAQGILTSTGGVSSHAALVARQMGKVCVAGCGELDIDYKKKTIKIKGKTIKEGDYISIDGTTGDQRFFLAWAQNWRGKLKDERLKQDTLGGSTYATLEARAAMVRKLGAIGAWAAKRIELVGRQRLRAVNQRSQRLQHPARMRGAARHIDHRQSTSAAPCCARYSPSSGSSSCRARGHAPPSGH